MSTRYAAAGGPLRQNRFASDPLYVAERGVNGTAAADKASISTGRARALIYFLQSLSRTEMGLRGVAEELAKMFPERLGCPRMHERGIKAGKVFEEKDAIKIDEELGLGRIHKASAGVTFKTGELIVKADDLVTECKRQAEFLDEYLVRLCIDPNLEIEIKGEPTSEFYRHWQSLQYSDPNLLEDWKSVGVPYFRDLTSALVEYQDLYSSRAAGRIAMTSIAVKMFGALDRALKMGKMVLINGNSGIGKSESLKAWCDMHRDRVRYLELTGITNRTMFFRRLAAALGVCDSLGMSASKVQARCESFLEKSKLMLVIDEGQYLFPAGERVKSHPELINWINTALFNNGIPVAIVATNEFHKRRQAVEKHSSWSAEQFFRRIWRAIPLPEIPTDEDLRMVARKLLPAANKPMLQIVVAYAKSSQRFLSGIVNVRDDARLICEEAGRTELTAADIFSAIKQYRLPSDEIMRRQSVPTGTQSGKRPPSEMPASSQNQEDPISTASRRPAGPLHAPAREISPSLISA